MPISILNGMYIMEKGMKEKVNLRPEHMLLKQLAPTKDMREFSAAARILLNRYAADLKASQKKWRSNENRVDNNFIRNLINKQQQELLSNFLPVNTPGSTPLTPPPNKPTRGGRQTRKQRVPPSINLSLHPNGRRLKFILALVLRI